ncbi:MAG: LolA-like outer membrane lipoprotein chaperone, partial [Helicobacter sp.]|nr:LolA-like outer membrane lipoprotein chaperone [Helicobacter sp.]
MKKILLFLFNFCFLCTQLFALEFREGIKTFEARFIQTLTSQNGENIIYEGEVYFKIPNFALWKYTKPIPKEIYLHDNTSIVYEPKLQQAIISKLQENIDIFSLMRQAKKINENIYEAEVAGQVYNIKIKDGIPQEINFLDTLE